MQVHSTDLAAGAGEPRPASPASPAPNLNAAGAGGKVITGLVLGIVCGIFFGERAAVLKIAGDAFILMLQIAVIPYITVSLITALGRLSLQEVRRLGLKGGALLLLLWAIGIVVVLLTSRAFPDWPSASFFTSSQVDARASIDFLHLYIPSNPFNALANAIVPAVVVFCILVGLALTGVPNKNALLEPLSAVADALMGVTSFIARLAPYGVFALTANAAGTIDVEQLARLQVYVVTQIAMALLLGLWLLPALIAMLTPLRYGELLRALRGPLIAAFATGSLLVVLPTLALVCKALLDTCRPRNERLNIAEADASIDVLVPAAYNFPTLGLVLSLTFLPFAGWFLGVPVEPGRYFALAAAGIASLFGGTPLAMPFLLDLLELPQDLFQLFLTVDVLTSRFGTLLAAMHVTTIALIGAFALQRQVRVGARPLIRLVITAIVALVVTLGGIRAFYTFVVVAPYRQDRALTHLHMLVEPRPWSIADEVATDMTVPAGQHADLAAIRRRGHLRICFVPNDYPSAFFNADEPRQLVGFDIEMAHRFARSVNLPIRFVPVVALSQASEYLQRNVCDIHMSSLAITPEKTESLLITTPVYRSSAGLIVRDHDRDRFQTWSDMRAQGASLRVAVSAEPDVLAAIGAMLPQASLIPIDSGLEQQRLLASTSDTFDGMGSFSEKGAAWTLLYPQYTLVVPKPTLFVQTGYAVALGNESLLRALNAWLTLEQGQGTVDLLYRHWMLGEGVRGDRPPRWSIIRNVLGWVK